MKHLLAGWMLLLALSTTVAMGADHTTDPLATVKAAIADGKAVLVDVREQSEWNAGYVEGAILAPLSELNQGGAAGKLKDRLPKGKILYTYCKAGVRSRLAADHLKAAGYDVRALKAGYQDLIDAGFPKGSK